MKPFELDIIHKLESVKFNVITESPLIRGYCQKSRNRFEEFHSADWGYSTPHLYRECEVNEQPYFNEPQVALQQYDQCMEEDSEEEDEDDNEDEAIAPTARSDRGLKRLSIKVKNLVFKLKQTSFKDVANRLIQTLVSECDFNEHGK